MNIVPSPPHRTGITSEFKEAAFETSIACSKVFVKIIFEGRNLFICSHAFSNFLMFMVPELGFAIISILLESCLYSLINIFYFNNSV